MATRHPLDGSGLTYEVGDGTSGDPSDAYAAAAAAALQAHGAPGGQGRPDPIAPPPVGGDSLPAEGAQTWAD